ncbi:FecR family protein [Puia sp. P3]|uniref:FecR family protein n=1 Tax=Puia sp. P3 TaxID=3423952 RepID=UPI003D66FBFC
MTILLSRRIAGELSPAEAEELRLALDRNPELQTLLAAIDGVQSATPADISQKDDRQMLEAALRQFRQRTTGLRVVTRTADRNEIVELPGTANTIPSGRGRRAKILRWSAAAIVMLATAGIYLYKGTEKPTPRTAPTYREVAAKYGTRSYVDLPDGSRLWLNAGSKVRYSEGFADGKRELTLAGEAFFDVKHDPEHPFLIHAGGVDVKVLGTSLNVRAYPGDSVIETTLIQGRAEIELPGKEASPIALRPNEKVTMRNETLAVQKDNDQRTASQPTYQRRAVTSDPTYKTIIETSWVEDKLVFRKEPFRKVAAQLERWYNIRFQL